MKKVLYTILLAVELAAGFVLLTLVTGGAVGWTCFWFTITVWFALTALMLLKLKRAADERVKHRIKNAIALVMLIPLVTAICGLAWFVVITTMRAV